MERKIILKNEILAALKDVGVTKGQTIMVHTSLSSLGFVCGGAQPVIEALLESVGLKGVSAGGASFSDKHANFIINQK